MKREHKSLRTLWNEEKLHIKLLLRLALLGALSLGFGGMMAYRIALHGLDPLSAVCFTIIGFLFGLFLFSRMNVVVWDEEKEMLSIARMDAFGAFLFIFYFVFDFVVKIVLSERYHDAEIVTGLVLATVFGTLFGRLIGTVMSIYRTHNDSSV